MIDINKYKELKEKDAVEIIRTENTSALSYKKFDSATGERLANEVNGFTIDELNARKAELQAEIDEIDLFIKDYTDISISS